MIVTMILAHRFTEPIRRLGDRAAAIALGNFEAMPVTRRNDEIRDLTLSINRMAERLSRYENEVRRHEQLRILGQLGAGLAHQLRNAATGGRMAIELHQMRCSATEDAENREDARGCLASTTPDGVVLQRFLALGQTRDAPHGPVALDTLLDDALELVHARAVHAGVEIDYDKLAKSTLISGDADALRQLFVNLLINGLEAIGGEDWRKWSNRNRNQPY